jgi:hypothetical protein
VPSSTTYKPNPATVEASFDTTRTTEDVVVMPDGLTLKVTGEDGTRYALHVPLNAVEGGQVVRMTVVSSVKKTPFDSVFGAVKIEPEGMRFYAPVTLIIDAPAQTGEALSGFAFKDDGQDFHLAKASAPVGLQALASRSQVKLELNRAQSYGAGFATWARLSSWANTHRPSDLFNQLIAESIVSQGKDLQGMYERAFDEYISLYRNEPAPVALEPLLESYSEWLRLVRQDKLEAALAGRIAQGKDIIRMKVEALVLEIKSNCSGPGGDAKAWAALRAFKFIRYLDDEMFATVKNLIDPIQNCLTFEIRFDSEITLHELDYELVQGSSAKVSAAVTYSYDFYGSLFQPPTQALQWDTYSLTPRGDCGIVSKATTPGVFAVVNFAPMWALPSAGMKKPTQPLPRLTYMATQALSSWSVKCGSSDTVHRWDSNNDHWGRAFWDTHQNEQTNG